MRRWLRAGLLLLTAMLVALVVAAGLVMAVAHGFARERLRSELELRLADALGTPVTIEALDGVLYRAIGARGIRIGPAEARWIDADRLGIEWKGRASLDWRDTGLAVSLQRLTLDGLKLRIVSGEAWPWQSESDEPSSSTLAFAIDELLLSRAALEVVGSDGERWHVTGDAAGQALRSDAAGIAVASLELPRAELELVGRDGARLQIAGAASGQALRSDAAGIAVASLAFPRAELELVGRDGARLQIAGAARAQALRSDAAGIAVEGLALSGRADTAVRAEQALRELGRFELAGAFELASATDDVGAEADGAGASASTGSALRWRAERFQIDGPVVQAEGRGSGDAAGIESAAFDLRVGSLTQLVGELAALRASDEAGMSLAQLRGGALRGHVELQGSWQALTGVLDLEAESLALAERRLGDLRLAARSGAPGEMTIQTLSLRGGELDLRVRPGAVLALRDERVAIDGLALELAPTEVLQLRGTLPRAPLDFDAWSRDPRLALKLEAEALPVSRLLALAPELAKGLKLDEGRLGGNLQLAGHAQGARASGWVAGTATSLEFDGNRAQALDARIELSGPLARPKGRIHVSAAALHATDRELGEIELALGFTNLSDFEVEALEWRNGRLPARVVPGSRFQWSKNALRLQDLLVESGEQRVRANGRVALREAGRVVFDGLALEVEALSLPWVRERLREAGLIGPDVSVSGAVTGRLVVDGPIDAPALESDLEIREFASTGIAFERVTFEARSPADRLEVISRWDRNGGTVLNLALSAPRRALFSDPLGLLDVPEARLELDADHFDLAALEAFAPARVEALRGTLVANVALRGGAPAQVERGTFELLGGSVKLAQPRQLIGPIAATGTLGTGAIEITHMTVGPPEAQLVGEGRIDRLGSGDEQLSGTVRFDAYPFKLAGLAKADLNGSVQVAGPLAAPRVDGRLVLSKVNIWLPDANAPELKEILVGTGSASGDGLSISEAEEAPGVLDRVAYDIAIEMERGSWARGRGVEAELAGELRLQKSPRGRESYSGEVHTIRGTYEVYGRRFQIDRGLATLDGASKIDPVLDILAKHRIRNVQIDAIVGGRLSDPTLRFESNPDMSETDIASYLLLGRPAATARGDDAVAVQMTAARLAAGLVSSELDRLLAPILPVDVIDVRVDKQEDEDALALGVGKYIGERLFLQYDRRFGRESLDELRAEYELSDHWSVESSATSSGEAGGDLIFNIEY